MPEAVPERGDMSMSGLAALLTSKELNFYKKLVGLTFDPETQKNLATWIDEPLQLGPLSICSASSYGMGKKILTTTALIRGVPTEIGIYRVPLPQQPDRNEW